MEAKESAKKILIVDDDEAIRCMLRITFASYGYGVIEAEDGFEGLNKVEKEHPPLVVTDIYMPNMTGLHLLRRIRREWAETKVILMTGYSHYRQLVEDQNMRPDGYFDKPFNISEIMNKVHALIGEA